MKKLFENIKTKLATVDKGTIIRTATLILAYVNQVIAIIGASTFANAMWYQVISLIATGVTSFISAWENNDWTHPARLATNVLNAMEDGKITEDEVKDLLEKAKKDTTENK